MRAFDRRLGWRAARGAAVAAMLVAGGQAHGQAVGATYPKSRALNDVAAWVVSDTPLQLPQIVDIGPSAVTAVTSAAPTGEPRGFLANIASEALDPAIGRQEDILSWRMQVEIDCERRAVRLGDMTGFPGRDLKTAPRVVRPGDTQWVQPTAGAPLGAVMRALCDRDYKRPFVGGTKIAEAPKAKPGPPPQVVTPKPPPAAAQPSTATAAPNPAAKPAKPVQPTTEKAAEKSPAEPKSAASPSPPVSPPAQAPAEPKASPPTVRHGNSPYLVQVGASPSQDDAKGLLGRLQKKFGGELSGLKTEIVTANPDGKTVYRVLISGFAAAGDANRLCAALKAGGQACFVRK